MNHFSTKVTGNLLVTFFIFITACSSMQQVKTTQEISQKEPLPIENGLLSEAQTTDPETPRDFYNIAFNAFDDARKIDVESRSELYRLFIQNLDKTNELALAEGDVDLSENASKLLLFAWEKEHNQAITLLNPENKIKPNEADLFQAEAHVSNAIILMPDSLISYELKAQIQYVNNQYEEAVRTIDLAMTNLQLSDTDAARLEDKRNYLSTALSPNLISSFTDIPVPYKVINALLDEGNWFEAINTLQAERSKKPEQKQLIRTLALVHFKIAEERFDQIVSRIVASRTGKIRLSTAEKGLLNEADSHYQQAENLLNELGLSSDGFINYEMDTARFYHNGAWYFSRLRTTNWLPSYAFDLRVTNYANKAIESYKRLIEEDDKNENLWKTVASLYELMGKSEEAKSAAKRAS